jgi:hypothetical protein
VLFRGYLQNRGTDLIFLLRLCLGVLGGLVVGLLLHGHQKFWQAEMIEADCGTDSEIKFGFICASVSQWQESPRHLPRIIAPSPSAIPAKCLDFKCLLRAVEIERAFKPSWRGFSAAEEGAGNLNCLACGVGDFQTAAVA